MSISFNLHSGVQPDLLQTAMDGFGNTVNFSYSTVALAGCSAVDTAAPAFPYSRYVGSLSVACAVTASNGIGGTFTHAFSYYNAVVHLQGRGFSGFDRRTSTDSRTGIVHMDSFRIDYPFSGSPSSSLDRQSNWVTKIAEANISYSSITLASGYETRYLPYLSSATRYRYELGGAFNGALIESVATANVAPEVTSGEIYDSTTTTSEYASGNGVSAGQSWTRRTYLPTLMNDAANWCLGRPTNVQQTNSHSGYGGTANTRTTISTWDAAQCRPTQTVVAPYTALAVTTDIGYDLFGNVNSQTVTGYAMTARQATTNWGSTGQLPVSNTVGAGTSLAMTTQTSWNYSLVAPNNTTDQNGLVTSYLYDNFGRRMRETRPDGTYTVVSVAACDVTNNYCGVPSLRGTTSTTQINSAGAAIRSKQSYFDQFDRTTHSYAQGLNGDWSYTYKVFDTLGRVAYEYEPYKSSGPTYPYRLYAYDLLGRRTQSSRWTSATNSTWLTTTTYYEGLTTRIVDPLGKQTKTMSNAAGQVRRSEDHNGYYQQFDFDAFGNAVRVVDQLGVTLQSAVFNVRGMRTQSTDADMGTWNYCVNAQGELCGYTDAKSQSISMAYDLLGRLTQRDEPSPNGGMISNTFAYGTSQANKNVGQLIAAQVAGGGVTTYLESYLFDSLGRPSRNQYPMARLMINGIHTAKCGRPRNGDCIRMCSPRCRACLLPSHP